LNGWQPRFHVTKRQAGQHDGSVKGRAEHLDTLRPRVTVDAATEAVEEIDALTDQFTDAGFPSPTLCRIAGTEKVRRSFST
jgi:hypothetical protein